MAIATRTAGIIKMLIDNRRVTVGMIAEKAGKDPKGYAFKSAMARTRKVLAAQTPKIEILIINLADGWFLADEDKPRAQALLDADSAPKSKAA